MEQLLPDRLKELWRAVDEHRLSVEAFTREQERLLDDYRRTWTDALVLDGRPTLRESVLAELGTYMSCADPAEIEARCTRAAAALKSEWQAKVMPSSRESIEQFYDESQNTIYELMWWHTLIDDASPLAYVTALRFAQRHPGRRYLDFGAGVGSGSILFGRHGFDVTLADISSTLLRFSAWRLDRRRMPATCVDLKKAELPADAFDVVTAMDVFEHLVDPVETVDKLAAALKAGGLLYARIAAEDDEDRPQHIVHDFGPTFERLTMLGFVRVWQDEWLWGHQVFQKSWK
jgi:2-polyprenyl-3-methyl-5-hydroxy-6-metoxy-1,4-benzoquinol methylase